MSTVSKTTRFARLNGWRRLWVVFAIGLLFYAIGLGLNEGAKQYRVEYSVLSAFGSSACASVIQMPVGAKLDPEPRYTDHCFDLYMYRKHYKGAADTKEGYVRHMNSEQNAVMVQATAFALVVWLLCESGLVVFEAKLDEIGKALAEALPALRDPRQSGTANVHASPELT